MITTRLALLLIRVLLSTVALVYSLLKIAVAPDPTPLFGFPAASIDDSALPINTTPLFATFMLALTAIVALHVIIATSASLWSDFKRFGHPAPFSSPGQIALLTISSLISIYYFIVSVLVGGMWFYTLTLAALFSVLTVYEGRQYGDFNEIKDNPLGN
jgi:hypothetical protein